MGLVNLADGEALHNPLVGPLHGGGVLVVEGAFVLVYMMPSSFSAL